jgi:putative membrane protein
MMGERRRFPDSVYGQGSEPDPRFSLANERTALAWIRTALALVALGIALEALHLPIVAPLRLAASILLIALGALAAVHSWIGWSRTERSLRLQRALPGVGVAGVIAVAGCLAAVALIVGLLV